MTFGKMYTRYPHESFIITICPYVDLCGRVCVLQESARQRLSAQLNAEWFSVKVLLILLSNGTVFAAKTSGAPLGATHRPAAAIPAIHR